MGGDCTSEIVTSFPVVLSGLFPNELLPRMPALMEEGDPGATKPGGMFLGLPSLPPSTEKQRIVLRVSARGCTALPFSSFKVE